MIYFVRKYAVLPSSYLSLLFFPTYSYPSAFYLTLPLLSSSSLSSHVFFLPLILSSLLFPHSSLSFLLFPFSLPGPYLLLLMISFTSSPPLRPLPSVFHHPSYSLTLFSFFLVFLFLLPLTDSLPLSSPLCRHNVLMLALK